MFGVVVAAGGEAHCHLAFMFPLLRSMNSRRRGSRVTKKADSRLHRQPKDEELLILLEGKADFRAGAEVRRVCAGDFHFRAPQRGCMESLRNSISRKTWSLKGMRSTALPTGLDDSGRSNIYQSSNRVRKNSVNKVCY
jgi:hypothetical protein